MLNIETNHGVGFQIIHFAEVAVVAPTFYWHWGSVLSKIVQVPAPWDRPTEFSASVNDVVGCGRYTKPVQHAVVKAEDSNGRIGPCTGFGVVRVYLFHPG